MDAVKYTYQAYSNVVGKLDFDNSMSDDVIIFNILCSHILFSTVISLIHVSPACREMNSNNMDELRSDYRSKSVHRLVIHQHH